MNREGLLRSIAETGYNVGFGAKKNFATHDVVQKAPGLIGFLSLAVGVFALIYEPLKQFTFWRDKMPLSLSLTLAVATLTSIAAIVCRLI